MRLLEFSQTKARHLLPIGRLRERKNHVEEPQGFRFFFIVLALFFVTERPHAKGGSALGFLQ